MKELVLSQTCHISQSGGKINNYLHILSPGRNKVSVWFQLGLFLLLVLLLSLLLFSDTTTEYKGALNQTG